MNEAASTLARETVKGDVCVECDSLDSLRPYLSMRVRVDEEVISHPPAPCAQWEDLEAGILSLVVLSLPVLTASAVLPVTLVWKSWRRVSVASRLLGCEIFSTTPTCRRSARTAPS